MRAKGLQHRYFSYANRINGQVRLVRLIRLQMNNFHLFFSKKNRTNDKLPFAQLVNGKSIKENRLDFRVPFETATQTYISILSIYIIYLYIYKSTSISICTYIHRWASPFSPFAHV
jgi:hypothetical protein